MLDLVAELISEIIRSCPNLVILTTSWAARRGAANRFRRARPCGFVLAVSRLRVWLSAWCSGSIHCDRGVL